MHIVKAFNYYSTAKKNLFSVTNSILGVVGGRANIFLPAETEFILAESNLLYENQRRGGNR